MKTWWDLALALYTTIQGYIGSGGSWELTFGIAASIALVRDTVRHSLEHIAQVV